MTFMHLHESEIELWVCGDKEKWWLRRAWEDTSEE
jgi:hypothetical protein